MQQVFQHILSNSSNSCFVLLNCKYHYIVYITEIAVYKSCVIPSQVLLPIKSRRSSRTLTSVIWSASMQLNVIIVYKLANLANCNQPVSLAIESVTQTATMIALNVLNFILCNRQLHAVNDPSASTKSSKSFYCRTVTAS